MKFITKIKERINAHRNPLPIEQMEERACENCGHQFKGHFCPNCGQELAEFNRPFGFFLYDIFGNFFAFDTRLFKTFKYLLFKPGFVSIEFFKGRRVRYTPPVRILVFLSFILFFLLQILSERLLEKSLDTQFPDETVQTDSLNHNQEDSLDISANGLLTLNTQEEDTSSVGAIDSDSISVMVTFDNNLRSSLQKMGDQYAVTLAQTKSPEKKRKLESIVMMCRMPELVVSKVLKLLSWAFFALVPLLALILELFYLRQRQRYIKHLIFSTHFHSFQFVILILISVLALLFDSKTGWLITGLLLTVPVYAFLAMKRFYGQKGKHVFMKFVGVGFLYQILLITAVIVVIVKSFGLM